MSIYGLTKVYDSQDAKVDIVFLHGLRGDAQKTWTKNTVLWPKDLLPKEIPETRVFLFGYDSGIVHRDPSHITNTEIQSDAADVCAKLHAERSSTGTADRPIIFIAHSLGGLVASQVLVLGDQKDDSSSVKAVTQNLRGLIFLGTPFQGSPAASLGENVRKVLKLVSVSTQQHTLELLTKDSQRLRQLVRSFADILNKRRMSHEEEERIEAFFCYETLKTSAYGIPLMQIVEPDSAQIPGCGDAAPIRADHVNICKFEATTDEGYGIIIARIRKIMAPAVPKRAASGRNLYNYGKIGNQAMGDQNIYGQTLNL